MAATAGRKLINLKFGAQESTPWGGAEPGLTSEGISASVLPRASGPFLRSRCWGCSWNHRELKRTLPLGPTQLQKEGGRAITKRRSQHRPTIEASTSPASPRGIVLTGASKGLGFAMAQEFLKQGDHVVICSRSQEGVDKAVAALKAFESTAGGRIYGVQCNVGAAEDVEKLSVFAREKLETVHIWLNNAGQVTSKRLLADVPIDEIQSAVSCNVLGSLLGSRAAVRLMREQPGAKEGPPPFHILNFGFTEFGAKNTKSATTHKATKSSLMWLTRALLEELKEAGLMGIGVHNCSPGMVLTDLLLKDSTPGSRRFFNALAEEPETVAASIVPQIRELRSRDVSIDFITPVGAIGKVVTGLPQILQGGRFFDKEGNRVRRPGAEYAENGVRVQVGEADSTTEVQEERVRV